MRQVIVGLSIALVAGCGGPSSEAPPPVVASTIVAALGIGDVFEVRVFGEPDLSGIYRVASNGTITFPLVGRLKISGLTASDASDLIAHSLEKFIRQPSVSVFVREYNSKKIYVFGEVKKAGTFPYEDGMSIVQAITLAGGFEKLADKNRIAVTRSIDGAEQRLEVPVKEIGEGKAPNFALEPGDIIWVPESLF